MSARKLVFAIVGLGLVVGFGSSCSGGTSPATSSATPSAAPSAPSAAPSAASAATASTTKLIIEITGGFAYVPDVNDRRLEIAYLNDVEMTEKDATGKDKVICSVDEIGTELMVLRGKIVSAAPPPNRTWDLDKTVVTIPALDTVNTPLTFARANFPPSPAKPTTAAHWQNLQYVPSLTKDFHTDHGIRPKWREEVNGRLVLRGGTLIATVPTDPAIAKADFEFKQRGQSKGSFAATDKTIYTVDVPGTVVELQLTSPLKSTTVKIEPAAPGQPVRLKMHGLHSADGVSSFANGQEVTDFCAFYSLLEPRVASKEMVKVFYNGPPASYGGPNKPSPGFFCVGDGF